MARKILLADDSVTAQNMGRKILADAGYDVITVNNGSAALKKIAEIKPDLIVLDVYMPGYSGLEVCQRVKETGDTSRIPILLTVGKLEPFKPEEARRVRADGYIVKPFEASELLSALTKLEDKIVPRAETSKPGRFARTIAVVEEGRYDKTMAAAEDSGWKARIGFPSSKKKEPEADDVDDSSIYNPVNKDLRTTIDRRLAQAATEDTRVDLGALAPPGLPKDVTPEEIAALAAAAAQIKGTVPETAASEKPSEPVPAVAPQIEAKASEAKSADALPEEKVESAVVSAAPSENKSEQNPEPVAEKPKEVAADISIPGPADVRAAMIPVEPVTYFSAHASENTSESRPSTDEPVTMAVAAGANGASATPRWAAVATALLLEESSISLEQEMQKAYAAFSASESAYAPSAGAVAEPPAVPTPMEAPVPENSIAEATPSPAPVADSVPQSASSEKPTASEPSQVSTAVRNFEVAATASAAQPAVSPMPEAVAMQVAEVDSAAASGLILAAEATVTEARSDESTVAALPVVETAQQDAASATAETVPVEQVRVEPVQTETVQTEPLQTEHQSSEPTPMTQGLEQKAQDEQRDQHQRHEDSRQDESRLEAQRSEEPGREESKAEESRVEEPRVEEPKGEESRPEEHSAAQFADAIASTETSESTPASNPVPPAPVSEVPAEQSFANPSASESSSQPTEASAAPIESRAQEPSSGHARQDAAPKESSPKDAKHKESEIAATTAAAWASWRRIRETGAATNATPSTTEEQKAGTKTKEEASTQHEAAAMAVAAGAEKAPEGIEADSDSDGGDIANIVDSVLADLRPKIVAEISKKMGKKK